MRDEDVTRFKKEPDPEQVFDCVADNNIVSPLAKFFSCFRVEIYKRDVGRNISGAGIPTKIKISFPDHDVKPVSGVR
jgi:hypothetical protein